MSKVTIGVVSGVVLAAAVAVPSLAATPSSGEQKVASTSAATSTARVTAAAVTTTVKAPTTTKTTTAKVTTPVVKVVLPVPAPAAVVPNPDPRVKPCLTDTTQPYCSPNSVRYFFKGTTVAAHNYWMPTLTKWGVTNVTDTCTTAQVKAQGTSMCVLRGDHGSSSITLMFKSVFDDRYSPATVDKQSDAIHAKAMIAVAKATTPAAQAKILQTANAQIAKLQATADAYNAKNPRTSVNVVFQP